MGERRLCGLVVVLCGLLGGAGAAHGAGWYYEWQCTGNCAPGQLSIRGIEGPFSSEAQCDSVRSADSRRHTVNAAGNAGMVGSCEYRAKPAGVASAGSSSAGVPAAKLTRLVMAVATTQGWTFTRPNGSSVDGDSSLGVEFEAHFGRALFGLDAVATMHGTKVAAPFLGSDDAQVTIASLLLGISMAPFAITSGKSMQVRPSLGLYAGAISPLGCVGDCNNTGFMGLGLRGKLGFDFHFGRSRQFGFSVDLVIDRHQLGALTTSSPSNYVGIEAPTFMLRVAGFMWLIPNPV